ncbi:MULTISPECIES: bifunctional metallophosphatase/5'-nucleotidase [Brachymonas]|uniref:bifunctional metallophosphatase/5'-nucleotidase n=1 Tax=Brachymonas TaxID=28219 RepID=UPI002E78214D|nr:5'-nucleotidase C-terminal domain-containing protein [Brachymonas sp. J145]MEE1653828.1 5'-nucleotidase C-terminal domain-containing protein [Brachymonas sp. J145]
MRKRSLPYALPAILSLAGATLLTACGGDDDNTKPSEPAVVAKPLELTIAHVDDSHSNLDSMNRTFALAGQDVSVDAGGFPRVTAMIQAIRANNDNVLALHAGDAITGTLYFNRAGQPGEADAALMNTVCFDAFALGNHEFDKGDSGLKQFIDFLHKDPAQCKTPVLSANVQFGANSALNPQKAPGYVQPHIVVERDGQKIGIVGLTVAGKTKESSSPDPDTTFEKEATAAQRSIDQLKADGVNKIIVMSHIGYEADKALAAQLRGVDVIVGGDSHTLLGPDSLETYKAGSPSGDYPTRLQNADGDNVCLVHANEYAKVVGELKVNFDAEGKVTDCAGTPHVLIGDDYIVNKAAPDAATLKAIQDDVKASGFLSVVQPDAKALAVLEPFKKLVEVFKAKIVATAPQEICSRRVPGGAGSTDYGRSSAECNAIGDVSLRGGDIQQLVAQAYLDVANQDYGGADFTLQSGGGVRVPLKGEVTAANVIEVLPFGNMLWRLDITGAEAKSMIEDGLDATFKQGGSTGPYPYSAGLRFNVDASQAKGNRASNLQAFDKASNSWKALDMNKTYRLFVLSFNATGGDGYTTLANIPAERRMDIGVLDADVLQTWIDRISDKDASGRAIIRKLPVDQYSTQFFAAP